MIGETKMLWTQKPSDDDTHHKKTHEGFANSYLSNWSGRGVCVFVWFYVCVCENFGVIV